MTTTRQEQLDGVRELLGFLEEHEDFPVPFFLTYEHSVFCEDEADLLAKRRMFGRTVEKVIEPHKFGFAREFGPVRVTVSVAREVVCDKVKVGEHVVEAVPEHVEDDYEWVCPESFLVKLDEETAIR